MSAERVPQDDCPRCGTGPCQQESGPCVRYPDAERAPQGDSVQRMRALTDSVAERTERIHGERAPQSEPRQDEQ